MKRGRKMPHNPLFAEKIWLVKSTPRLWFTTAIRLL